MWIHTLTWLFCYCWFNENRLLVGAPKAQTEQPGVVRGGAVFRCSTEVPDECHTIPFDVTGIAGRTYAVFWLYSLLSIDLIIKFTYEILQRSSFFFNQLLIVLSELTFEKTSTSAGNNNASGQQIDQKSEQWFGATVRSAGPNGPVLVIFQQLPD